jgi:CheY-like chemotaxis protein
MSRARVLIVDHEPDVLARLAELVDSWGYAVIPIRSAGDALERLASEPPDLILAELNIEGASGVELWDRIKRSQQLRHTPIIAMSARQDLPIRLHGRVEAFFPKPVDVERLRSAIVFYLPEE